MSKCKKKQENKTEKTNKQQQQQQKKRKKSSRGRKRRKQRNNEIRVIRTERQTTTEIGKPKHPIHQEERKAARAFTLPTNVLGSENANQPQPSRGVPHYIRPTFPW